MKLLQKAMAFLLCALFLMSPCCATAEEGQKEGPAVDQVAEGSLQDTEGAAVQTNAYSGDLLYRQIQETYRAARKRAHRKSFKGYCGAYVGNQLVILGINADYLGASGKNTYDIYRNMDITTGGYRVLAYGAKNYSLLEALRAILRGDPSPSNILVGFQKGISSSGRKYGHVLFIHGIREGKVYYSDNCARTIEDVTYPEGEPIVCSLAAFVDLYTDYRLDGVVHFVRTEDQSSNRSETAAASEEKVAAQG